MRDVWPPTVCVATAVGSTDSAAAPKALPLPAAGAGSAAKENPGAGGKNFIPSVGLWTGPGVQMFCVSS